MPEGSQVEENSTASRLGPAQLLFGAAVACLLGWWAWKQGAYFGPVFYPGAILLALLVGLTIALAPFPARLRGAPAVALISLATLALWTGISVLWSEAPATAPAYAARVAVYAGLFLSGLWLALFLRGREAVALLPVALAGIGVGIATTVVLATGADPTWYLHDDATLRFPIGYRNANAALFLICLWPMLAVALDRLAHWALRAVMVAGATMMIELAVLAQSRGSVPALAVATALFLLAARDRLPAIAILLLAAVPAAVAMPTLIDVFGYGDFDPGVLPLLRDAAGSIAVTGLFSFALAAFSLVVLAPRVRIDVERSARLGLAVVTAGAVLVLVAVGVFLARNGGPIQFADERIAEFTEVGYPDLSDQTVRYGTNVGSNRADFWRVSLNAGLEQPLLGHGAGSFQPIYLRERRSTETPQDPHSAEMLMFSELGFPGLLLFLGFVGAAALACLRSRKAGSATVAAAGLAVGGQWLLPASYDWFWQYPGVTAPAMFILGIAAAPGLTASAPGRLPFWTRAGGVGAAALVIAVSVPLFLSDRYSSRAADLADSRPAAAIDDYGRAARLAPLDSAPLVARGVVAERTGQSGLALESVREALEREPDDYAARLLLARLLIDRGAPQAREALAAAVRLNPTDPVLPDLGQQLLEDGGNGG